MNDLELAIAMVAEPDNSKVTMEGYTYNYRKRPPIDAGLTYHGQMISHDIVLPTNKDNRERTVTGKLELDSLYGPIPKKIDGIVAGDRNLFSPSGRFLLSSLTNRDLNRDEQGKALIPESRNDENTIISQLHNVWLRLHNFLLNQGYAATPLDARKLVMLTFQLITIEDFLKSFLKSEVFDYFFVDNKVDIVPDESASEEDSPIPDYFSKASFRFGHSSVRRDYDLSSDGLNKEPLSDLFRRNLPLIADFTIDWRVFFKWSNEDYPEPATQPSFAIDTLITPIMSVVPMREEPAIHIAAANIRAGRQTSLPLGLTLANQYSHLEFISSVETTAGSRVKDADINELPLWAYILLEAEKKQKGQCLGGLGSVLNAQVLRKSMATAHYSVFNHIESEKGQSSKYEYDFDIALEAMGEFGELLRDKQSQYGNKLSMYSIIELLP